jgi:uncharacterized damage-inducible protein DinB
MKKKLYIYFCAICFIACESSIQPTMKKETNTIHDFAAYNEWANTEFFNWLENLPDSIIEKETPSSFTTIKQTLAHMWGAEHGWLTALKREEWTRAYQGDAFQEDTKAIIQNFKQASETFTQYVLSLSQQELDAEIEGSDGKKIEAAAIILHVINHASYHRGQIVTMARTLGVTNPPRTDYVYFIRR